MVDECAVCGKSGGERLEAWRAVERRAIDRPNDSNKRAARAARQCYGPKTLRQSQIFFRCAALRHPYYRDIGLLQDDPIDMAKRGVLVFSQPDWVHGNTRRYYSPEPRTAFRANGAFVMPKYGFLN